MPGTPGVYADANGATFVADEVAEGWEDDRRAAAASTRPAAPRVTPSWSPVDLEPIVAAVLAGEEVGPVPTLIPRSDGACLAYRGEIHSIAAEPESGKSWIVQAETGRLLVDGERVIYFDFEDTPGNIVARLLALGTSGAAIVDRFTLVRPETPLSPETIRDLTDNQGYALAVVDGVTEAMALLGLEIGSNDDVAKFRKLLARPLAASGAAVVEIDHVVKNAEARGRFAIGGGHKLAGVAVAYSVTAVERPSRTRAGLLKITVEKDRHGRVRQHEDRSRVIALARITPTADGARVSVTLDPPDSSSDTGAFRPTVLMARIGDYVEANPGATRNDIKAGVKGNTDAKDAALRALVTEKFVKRVPDGQALRHYHLKPFTETTGPLVPDRSQPVPRDQQVLTGPPVPTPYKGDRVRGPVEASTTDTLTGPTPAVPISALTADVQDEAA